MIFGHIAPSKVAAPNPGYNFRIVSRFSDQQLADDVSRLDVAYTATDAVLGINGNVVSVDTSSGEAGVATVIEVGDENLIQAANTLSDVFGPVEVRVADPRIAGVDVIVTLGTDYLGRLDTAAATATLPAASTASTAAETAPSTGDGG